jgi:hypothetical protein
MSIFNSRYFALDEVNLLPKWIWKSVTNKSEERQKENEYQSIRKIQ